jgi:excisionase family DNA binding protein
MGDAYQTPLAVSVDEAARRAGVGRGYLYQQISRGKLRARKAGRRTLIALSDLAAWVEQLPTFATEASGQ